MVGAMILIVIVIGGFSFLVYPLLAREYSTSQLSNTQKQAESAMTMLQLIYYNLNGQKVQLYIYNYGQYAFRPSEIIISLPTAGTYTVTNFSMNSGPPVIGPGETVELSFSVPYTGSMPSSFNVSVIGNGTAFTWNV